MEQNQRLNRLYARTGVFWRWASNPTMRAIRSGLLLALPLVMAGCFALLINQLPIPAYQRAMLALFGPNWPLFGATVWSGTLGVLTLLMVFSISQQLTIGYNQKHPLAPINPIITALVSFSSLIVITPRIEGVGLTTQWTGSGGLFVGIIVALAATRLFLFLARRSRFSLHVEGSDAAIPQAFASLVPGFLTVLVFSSLSLFFDFLSGDDGIQQFLHNTLPSLFSLLDHPFGSTTAYIVIGQGLWFIGVHGANLLDPVNQIYTLAFEENLVAHAAGAPMPHIVTKVFLDTFVYMGGAGSSLCLLAALLLASKSSGSRKLAKLSILPGIFNINEPLLFGLPVILNPVFLIPFILTPLTLALCSYLAIVAGLVPLPLVSINWTTPPIIGGYIATGSIAGSLLQCFNLCLGTLIYIPFVKISDRIKADRRQEVLNGLLEVACSNRVSPSGKKCLDRSDEIGALARALANDLQTSLQTGAGLYVEYQPQINHLSGRVIGAEGLIRWQHPVYGLIPAPIMVAVSEDGDFIKPLGLWVLHEICGERKRLRHCGIDDAFRLSVNVSVLQLNDRNLLRKILDALTKHDLQPSLMGIEITESVALDLGAGHSKVLREIHQSGIAISIDDFSMGHSSPLYLKHFPVDVLKIDKTLSKDITENHTSVEIVTAIVKLCRALDVDVIVEHIENQAQIDLLRKLDCHIFQGYFFSKPIDGEKLLAYLQAANDRGLVVRSDA
ncbi:MAG: EAL domain-containing protein [Azonexus sp.]|jgi:lactose/cellobiose-specific phosphotransferase system IIC component|nr:EAL domain-containing protein [Azonexus sp.]